MTDHDDLTHLYERSRRARRRKLNRRFKERDYYKPRGILHVRQYPNTNWRHDPFELDWQFNRRKSHPETGYGVAWEHRSDVQ